ncbi:spore germination lipoprotein GerD [Salibacterium aidingense]|uniref:spore germination lipoprotein GerD n=1 Tax=Salibacterium aidingense TaxID=384933 RepID=UPI00040393F8|nr:spore germination lipoprotein GerD [Salibacterium aidingense]
MLSHIKTAIFIFLCISALAGCAAAAEDQGSGNANYEETKKMLVDLLKSDEGKQAISDILSDEQMREKIVMDQELLKKTVEDTLTAEKGKSFWQELLKDPEFSKTFADSMQKNNEKMLKSLMKDPEYQQMLIDVMKDPEMEKATLELLKGKEYRQQVMNIMSEAMESPRFKSKITGILEKVAEQQTSKEDQQGGSSSGGGGGG